MKKLFLSLIFSTVLFGNATSANILVFNDFFTDSGRFDGTDTNDTNWWTSTGEKSIEVTKGSLGLVTGSSGRGIRATFAPQTLEIGESIKLSYTFIVPQTVGTKKTAFRVGMFNMLDREGLKSDLNSSSKSPNPLFDGLLGYMIDYDVNLPDTTETTIGVYRRNDLTTGRLLGAMNGFTKVGEGGTDYSFFPGQIYTGSMTLKNLLEGVEITGSISHFGKMLSQFNTIDRNLYIDNIGMLGFHVNSKVFGSSKEVNTPDNGIDFLDVKVEILPKL